MKLYTAGFAAVVSFPAWGYDQPRVEAYTDLMAHAALCLEVFNDREVFELTFNRLSVANQGNPDPTSWVALQGIRDGVVAGAKQIDTDSLDRVQLRENCDLMQNDIEDW